MTTALVTRADATIGQVRDELSIDEMVAQVRKIQEAMKAVMRDGEHYGIIPGTNAKPTLMKAGAEKLCLMFRLDPEYTATPTRDGSHLDVLSHCTLYHIPTGQRLGSGMGSCSTRESKYAYRQQKRSCPACGVEGSINRSKYPPQGGGEAGWYCHDCKAQYAFDAQDITQQHIGRVPNPDLADQYNTVLKMGNKRSLIAAVLNVTAASDIFTQDLEDLPQPAVVIDTQTIVPGPSQADTDSSIDVRALSRSAAVGSDTSETHTRVTRPIPAPRGYAYITCYDCENGWHHAWMPDASGTGSSMLEGKTKRANLGELLKRANDERIPVNVAIDRRGYITDVELWVGDESLF